jgi:hypothetical protein
MGRRPVWRTQAFDFEHLFRHMDVHGQGGLDFAQRSVAVTQGLQRHGAQAVECHPVRCVRVRLAPLVACFAR